MTMYEVEVYVHAFLNPELDGMNSQLHTLPLVPLDKWLDAHQSPSGRDDEEKNPYSLHG